MENEKDEQVSPWKGPASVTDPKARRWMSSTAASLLDNHDEEEEDGLEEPDLLSVSIESATDSSGKSHTKKVAHHGLNIVDQSNAESATVSSVVRLTEGMTAMLCSAPLDGSHRRIDSETEVLQKDLSTGHCGTAPFCLPSKETPPFSMKEMGKSVKESLTMLDRIDTLNNMSDSVVDESESTLGRSDTLRKTEPINCAEFNLIDLQKLVATDIMDVLGSSTGVATEWFATLAGWLVPSSHESQQRPRRVFRNRCSVRKAQSHRLKELWYKWHSNGSDDSSSRLGYNSSGSSDPMKPNPNMPPFRLWSLAVTKSLDDAELVAPVTSVPLSQSLNNMTITPPVKEVRLFPLETSKQRSPTPPVDLYYDSDPEIFRVTRRSPAAASNKDDYIGKKPLRWRRRISIPTPINTSLSVDGKEIVRPLTPKHVKGKRAPSFDIGSFDSDVDDRFDLLDDSLVKDFIKELTTDKVNLVWHPSPEPNKPKGTSMSPVAVQGWFEMGSRLYNRVIQPKFMWRESYQPDLLNHKRLGLSGRSPHSLDLLNMIRILKPTVLDRTLYPFTKLDRTFTILSHTNENYVFEAASIEERDWLVHGLKLVVARLASMIIVGDEHIFVEFFSPWANSPISSESEESSAIEQGSDQKGLFTSTNETERNGLWGAW